jgi:zinc transporter ZupT
VIEVTVVVVFLAALLTALATGLGAVPFLLTRAIGPWHVGIANAIAAGLMMAASHSLIAEGLALGPGRTLLGVLLGLVAIVAGQSLIARGPDHDVGALRGADAKKAILIVGVMTAHSFAEGVGVGVSFGGTTELATYITAAIAIHNIPEGLAISLVLVPRGATVRQAAAWSVFSSLPQPIMAVPAYLFVTAFSAALPVGLGFAAGAMIWMVFAELVPDAIKAVEPRWASAAVVLAFTLFAAFQLFVLPH